LEPFSTVEHSLHHKTLGQPVCHRNSRAEEAQVSQAATFHIFIKPKKGMWIPLGMEERAPDDSSDSIIQMTNQLEGQESESAIGQHCSWYVSL
jgi:hypothetical protein